MFTRRHMAVIATTALATILAGCGGSASSAGGDDTNEPIKLGMIQSLTGPGASFGNAMRNAAEARVKDYNANGGVLGRQIELVVLDDATDPTKSAQQATELIAQKVPAILGASTSSTTLSFLPIAAQAKIPTMAIAAAPAILDKKQPYYDWTWRAVTDDSELIPAIVQRVADLGHKKVAVFAQDDAYGKFGTKLIQSLAKEKGLEVTDVASAALTATDVLPQATRLRDSKPDAVIVQVTSVGLTSNFLRASADVGITVPKFGGIGAAQQALIEASGGAAEGLVTPNLLDPAKLSPSQDKLYKAIEAAGGKPQYGFADLNGASSVDLVVAAIKKAGKAEGQAINDALNSGVEDPSVILSPLSVSADDHAAVPVPDALVWTVVKDGKWTAQP